MRLILSLIFTIALSILSTGPLHAAGAGTCSAFGDRAVSQATRAQDLKCGFGNQGRFSTDKNAHVRGCRSVKDETLQDEHRARDHDVTKCAMCRHYSNEANAAARENVAFRCGFTGPGWLQDDGGPDDAHFKWCMGLSEEGVSTTILFVFELGESFGLSGVDFSLRQQAEARNKELQECKAKIDMRFTQAERNFCRDYGDKAVQHAMLNLRKKCGATPAGRWGVSDMRHFMWCLTMVGNDADKAVVERETAAREYAAGFCERGVKLSAEGFPPRPVKNIGKKKDQTATKTMEGRPGQQKQPKTSGGAGSADRGGTGGYDRVNPGEEAMRRVGGGGGYTPAYGGDSKTGGAKSGGANAPKTGGAAIITPVQAPVQTQTRTIKSIGKSDNTVEYGGGPKAPPPPRPVK